MLKEFKNFIMTGNVIDFAVAVIMAGALGAVINGFVNHIAMPFVGYFAGGMNFADLHVAMDGNDYKTLAAAQEAGGAVIAYGAWINTIINLLIVGLVMFMIVRAYNKTKKPPEEAAPAGPSEVDLLTEIRDSLKK
ncbi:MAG: large conductance mechanosensitive channel protein MscL [Bacteroidia bacterium]|nr:large conductance mechanosensitive channel protein MscL [Bacteroidia bacterium]NND25172.1 large conductance mechanosensitive channel protein MscL [Flavobacteriaceae bacterium]MBT8277873.1 large conductance mechanosensitive channel protein MscL [Bacteroidia bacterium]NNK61545.1 large conductance mechanosensitive channel protein MscL [Flavobacteriaceae bacterium]NNL33921.1 large conductance mechanosensitive channel protein MscL [Flavobacteriaceae bacterium]